MKGEIMGDIIYDFKERIFKPRFHIERRIDDNEKQILSFRHESDSWIITETGSNIEIYGRDQNGNVIQVEIPISVDELIEKLTEWRKKL